MWVELNARETRLVKDALRGRSKWAAGVWKDYTHASELDSLRRKFVLRTQKLLVL